MRSRLAPKPAAYAAAASFALGAALEILGGPRWLGVVLLVAAIGFSILAILWWFVGRAGGTRFDFSASYDLGLGQVMVNNRLFHDHVIFWVTVRNDGATSDFAARIPRVSGTPRAWGTDYRVLHPAWEHSPASELRIPGFGGERRLMLATVTLRPRAFWFYTAQFNRIDAGNQYLMMNGCRRSTPLKSTSI